MRNRASFRPWVVAGLVLVLACAPREARTPEPPPPEPIPAILARLADQAEATPARHPELNAYIADRLAADLKRPRPAGQRARAMLRLGVEQLRAGRTEEAIATLESLRSAVDRPGSSVDQAFVQRIAKRLALAYLRLGEQENCLLDHNAQSCLYPIGEGGRHQRERGSRRAMAELESLLEHQVRPDLVWLYNLAASTLGIAQESLPVAYRLGPTRLDRAPPFPRFPDRAGDLGIDVLGLAGGVVLDDLDGDGLLDVMVSSWGPRDPLRLLLNNGDGTFRSADAAAAGLAGEVGGLNLVHADCDNDGDLDILVLRGAWKGENGQVPNSLLLNDGQGRFTNVTRAAGLLDFFPTQTAAWADFDNDGWLDLFVGNETTRRFDAPSRLFRNRGDGTFTDLATTVGLELSAFVKGASWGDFDNDADPDLFVSIFGGPNQLWRNDAAQGGGRHFTEVAALAGVEEPVESFATWFWDVDNDGWLDLFVAGFRGFEGDSLLDVVSDLLEAPRTAIGLPRLFRNLGPDADGRVTFEDHTAASGLDTSLLAMGAGFGDLDNDGWLDAYFGTGEPQLSTLVPNRMFRNEQGRRFADITAPGGFGHLQKGHGIAFGDLDNDGDQDIYAVMGGAYSGDVYPNALFLNPGNGHRWLTLILEGVTSNRAALGARVHIQVRESDGSRRGVHRVVGTGGSFGSSSIQLEVGLGNARSVESVEVTWPAMMPVETFTGFTLDRFYRLREGSGRAEPVTRSPVDLDHADTSAHHHPPS